MDFLATVARGLEAVLARELEQLGALRVTPLRGAVEFAGELEQAYRACLFARSASRVLLPLDSFPSGDSDALYAAARKLPWWQHISAKGTIAVEAALSAGVQGHTRYLAQRTKDAICDRIRERGGARPSVDRERPDVRVHLHVGRERTTVSIDLSGESMHRRGYRVRSGRAPLRENLAAGLLLHAGWDRAAAEGQPLVDPMCGSGTWLVEAALIACDVAPGLLRAHHGAPGWLGHAPDLWRRLRTEAQERRRVGLGRAPRIVGLDASPSAVRDAQAAVAAAGLSHQVSVARDGLAGAQPPERVGPGILVANPPYGQRLGDEGELMPLYQLLGDILKQRFAGYRAFVLTASDLLAGHIGLRSAGRLDVYNGSLPCRLLEYRVGSAPATARGPGWRKPSGQAAAFENRLRKNARHFGRWASRRNIECYRVYDADVPEYNVAVDIYRDRAVVFEYAPPRSVDRKAAMRRLQDVLLIVPRVLALDPSAVSLKVRRRQVQGEQYESRSAAARDDGGLLPVREGACELLVDLEGHIDTGLFADHRELRALVAARARGQRFLNLYAYTCTASVIAAKAGAASTTSVDLSARYLSWGRANFEHNRIDLVGHDFVQADCERFLVAGESSFDVVLLNPPSYSRSHRMQGDFDVKRDHRRLIERAMARLARDGWLFFATHARGFALDPALARAFFVQDISAQTVPEDFRRSPHVACAIRHR